MTSPQTLVPPELEKRFVWTDRWLDRANQLASWSKDPSTKVGCVLVRDQHAIGEGYNGFPHGFNDSAERFGDRTTKYRLIVHAEENAIAHAARYGQRTAESVAYVTYPCCTRCATLLIQAGIRAVYVGRIAQIPDRYLHEAKIAARIFQEAGLSYSWAGEAGYSFEADLTLQTETQHDVRYVRLLQRYEHNRCDMVRLDGQVYHVYEWLSDFELLVHIPHSPEGV